MTREEFDKEIQEVIENRPAWSRKASPSLITARIVSMTTNAFLNLWIVAGS